MSNDPIVEEVHRIREQIAARFGYDIAAIAADAQARDAAGDYKVISLPPRRPPPPVTPRAARVSKRQGRAGRKAAPQRPPRA